MAKDSTAAPVKETKPRKPARTVEQQIADLQAKADARRAKAQAKASKTLADVEAKIKTAEEKLSELYAHRTAARETLGIEPDEVVTTEPADDKLFPESVDTEV